MLLVAFMQASNCSNYTGSWRHPETAPNFLDLQYYQDIARTLEAGKFHMAFIDDRLAMPSRYGDSYAEAVEHGVRAVKLDLVPIITAMGLATIASWAGGHLLDHLLCAIPRGATVRIPRSLHPWQSGLERGDIS